MSSVRLLVGLTMLVAAYHCANPTSSETLEQTLTRIENTLQELTTFKNNLQDTVGDLARQLMLQQLFAEERIRSDGGSGIKQIRATGGGTKPYHTVSTATSAVTAIHEHSNYDRTIGMGELVAVLNGVEFRTRHNDYKMVMPSTTSKEYDATEHIPFPEVPPSVLAKSTIELQVKEMQKYFKAFHNQDMSLRDYKPYFKPALCYMEAGWTTDTDTLTEPFQSDRHFIDATDWFDLQEKVMYTASSGGKSQFENYSYLPTTIVNVTADGQPIYAQWNYRILCHPIQRELRLKDLALVDDLTARMYLHMNMTTFGKSKAARFNIAPRNGKKFEADGGYGYFDDRRYMNGLLDDLMFEIPGKENYNAKLEDGSFGLLKHCVGTKNNTVLNVAQYHRHFKVLMKGAMGLSVRNRGFSDPNLFVAKTNNPRVAAFGAETCKKEHGKEICEYYEGRHTYAIPLEIIWLTPLQSWNPYNVTFYSSNQIPKANGRSGGLEPDTAYNGTSRDKYYMTPMEFFQGGDDARDPADTAQDGVGVLDPSGTVRQVAASGFRIFTPEIEGVGKVRIRYPVMPFHHEGNAIYKNLASLQDITMDMQRFANMFEERPGIVDPEQRIDRHYVTSTTHQDPPGAHNHDLYMTPEDLLAITNNVSVPVFTTQSNGHQHELVLVKDPAHPDLSRLVIMSCDNQSRCWDQHAHYVYRQFD